MALHNLSCPWRSICPQCLRHVVCERPWTIKGFRSDEKSSPDFPVEVDLEHIEGKGKETVRAKYLFSGEGARSFVREQLKIGIKHKDPIAHVWGVMDGVLDTNFPDIKVFTNGLLKSDNANIFQAKFMASRNAVFIP